MDRLMERASEEASSSVPPSKPVAAALKALNNALGKLRPIDVVERARDPKSVLHDCFEWDDTKAAEQWRLRQAAQLIREVSVTWVAPKGPRRVEAKVTRSRTEETLPPNRFPQSSSRSSAAPAARNRVESMRKALEDFLEVQQRFAFLSEIAGIRMAIAEFSKKVVDAERKTRN